MAACIQQGLGHPELCPNVCPLPCGQLPPEPHPWEAGAGREAELAFTPHLWFTERFRGARLPGEALHSLTCTLSFDLINKPVKAVTGIGSVLGLREVKVCPKSHSLGTEELGFTLGPV